MPGTGSVDPCSSTSQPVHWPQEMSNYPSLPPGNSTAQRSWEVQQLARTEEGFPLMVPPSSEGQACSLLPQKQKRWTEDRWAFKQLLSYLTPALGIARTLLVLSFFIYNPLHKPRQGAQHMSSGLRQGAWARGPACPLRAEARGLVCLPGAKASLTMRCNNFKGKNKLVSTSQED